MGTSGSPTGKLCPHCKLADETLFHRLWHRPRWQGIRLAELQGYTLAKLQHHFCNDTVCTGLVPSDALCLAAAATERAAAVWPAPVVLPDKAWSDGSALDPTDPILRRAGWAVVICAGAGHLTVAQGPCPGRQTAGRAELAALVWTSRCSGDCHLVSDSRYVCNGANAFEKHNMSHLLHGPDADLWALLVRKVPVAWIRSHLTEVAALDQGFSRADWLGNQAADSAAGEAALAHAATADQRSARKDRLEAAAALHRTMAAVEEAALAVNHAAGSAIVRRRKAKRRRPAKVFQSRRQAPKRPVVLRVVLDDGPPPGVHLLTPLFGPVPESIASCPPACQLGCAVCSVLSHRSRHRSVDRFCQDHLQR